MLKPIRKPSNPSAGLRAAKKSAVPVKLWTAKEGSVAIKGVEALRKKTAKIIVHRKLLEKNGVQKGIIGKLDWFGNTYWIYYPKQEHFQTFKEGSKFVIAGGPATLSPGSVGVIKTERLANSNTILIKNMQASFRTGFPAELNRSLATKYGGWRQHVLDEIFSHARNEGVGVAFELMQQTNTTASEKERRNVFINSARKNGFRVKETQLMLFAEKNHQAK
ncbi:MAG: hypothetical protein Q7R70_00245 [Candidatus Diapherotrites archaeon]|nr:hypothetical protein [Candidatus Diapherotrites archaeon]